MNQMTAIAPAAAPAVVDGRTRFTVAEFAAIATAGAMRDIRLELIDGDLFRMTPPMGAHFSRQSMVFARLLTLFGDRVAVEAGIQLNENSVLVCDVALLTSAITEMRFARAEEVTLVVEVAQTTLAHDMDVKRIRYASAGIPHYWIVDGQRSVVRIFAEPVDGDYAQISTVRFGEPLAVPGTDASIVIE